MGCLFSFVEHVQNWCFVFCLHVLHCIQTGAGRRVKCLGIGADFESRLRSAPRFPFQVQRTELTVEVEVKQVHKKTSKSSLLNFLSFFALLLSVSPLDPLLIYLDLLLAPHLKSSDFVRCEQIATWSTGYDETTCKSVNGLFCCLFPGKTQERPWKHVLLFFTKRFFRPPKYEWFRARHLSATVTLFSSALLRALEHCAMKLTKGCKKSIAKNMIKCDLKELK